MTTFTDQKTKRRLVAYGNYSSTVNCRTKIPSIFRELFTISRDISKYLSVYSTTSHETPNATQQNPCWETVVYTNISANYSHQRQGISDSFVRVDSSCVGEILMAQYSVLETRVQAKVSV